MNVKAKRKLMGGLPLFPLAVLVAIAFFDQFDSAAFNVLTPEIKRAFGLTTAEIGGIVALNIVMTTAFVLVIGYMADRMSRRTLVVVSGIVAAVTSFATGAASAVWVLVLLRFSNGAGRLVNDPVHTSLLSDYYPAENRAEAISLHRASEPLGLIVGPLLVGAVVALFGNWRWAFFVLALPAALAALIAARVREPLRGGTEDRQSAEEATREEPIPFSRAFRMLYHVRTLRRIWLANFFAGAALFPLLPVFALFWDVEYNVRTGGRSLIASLGAGASLLGVLIAGPITSRLLKRGPHLVQLLSGVALTMNAAFLFVVALSPNLFVAVAAFLLISFGFGIQQPTALTVASIVIPPRIRSQGFSYTPLFLTLGAILALPLGGVADVYGYRWALSTFAPILIVSGVLYASAFRFVAPDWKRAVKTLETEAKLREERLSAGARSLLVCRGLDVSYDIVQVLYDVNIEVKEGEIVALLGTNGAGKSTLLKCVAGLLHPDAGVTYFDGRNITFHEPEDTAGEGIALSPGGQALFPNVSVHDSLLAAAWTTRRSPSEVRERVDEALELFPRLRERLDNRAGTLSGGEQQMLALAQVMVSRPKLLMIDELTLGLAPKIVDELLNAVRAIHARGVTVILVEQSVNIAASIAQRCYFLERGQIRFEGAISELLSRPDLLRSVFLAPTT
jgi:branched-chain amino acid transport system ATP-binding protein